MPTSTRDRLLDSALSRFADEGVLGTTLDQVREGAGASVGAIYHHFPDKEALYDAVRARALADFQEAFATELDRHDEAEAGIRAVVELQIAWCAANRDAAKLLLEGRPSSAPELNRDFFPRILAWWRPHAHYGAVRDLDFLLIYALWLGPAMEVTRHWLQGAGKKPGRAQIETLADAAWAALKSPEAEETR